MSPKSGLSVGIRISPKTSQMLDLLVEKTSLPKSRLATTFIEDMLPEVERIGESYENGLLRIARWLDRLMKLFKTGKPNPAKSKGYSKEQFTVWLSDESLGKADKIAGQFFMTRSRLLALILDAGLNRFTVKGALGFEELRKTLLEIGKDLKEESEDIKTN